MLLTYFLTIWQSSGKFVITFYIAITVLIAYYFSAIDIVTEHTFLRGRRQSTIRGAVRFNDPLPGKHYSLPFLFSIFQKLGGPRPHPCMSYNLNWRILACWIEPTWVLLGMVWTYTPWCFSLDVIFHFCPSMGTIFFFGLSKSYLDARVKFDQST